MSDLPNLAIWQDAAIRSALSWYLEVAENRRPAKFRIAEVGASEMGRGRCKNLAPVISGLRRAGWEPHEMTDTKYHKWINQTFGQRVIHRAQRL